MSWAAQLVPACEDLAARLTAAGVPATLDRSALRVPGAWVMPSTAAPLTLSGSGTCRVNVLLVVPEGGDLEALKDLQRLLVKALTVIDPDEDVDTSLVFPLNNNSLPAFRLVVDLTLEE